MKCRVAFIGLIADASSMPLSEEVIDAIGRRSARWLEAEMRKWARTWSLPSLSRDVKVRVNRRLRTCVARFIRRSTCIEVGRSFLADPSIRREALGHELAHAAVARRYGKTSRIHGEDWRRHMKLIGFLPRRTIAAGSKVADLTRSAFYEHRCPVCQMTRFSKRRITGWRCRQCTEAGLTGELIITRLDHA
jgi:predicted SprT family Zn-dependent metalloprotease